jgi:hypothetical protein
VFRSGINFKMDTLEIKKENILNNLEKLEKEVF